MDHFYSGFLFLIVLQQGSGHDSPDSFFSSASAESRLQTQVVHEANGQMIEKRQTLFVGQHESPKQTLFITQDDFEQETWPYPTPEPVKWLGDLSHFRIETQVESQNEPQDSSNNVLRLDSPFAGYSALYTKQEGITGQWRATIYQDFTPSNTNRSWFYLMADKPLESNQINGYALRFGENGTEKQIRLFRLDNGDPKEILQVPIQIGRGGIEVRAMRDSDFNWLIEARLLGEEKWVKSEMVQDAHHLVSQYSGFYFTYSTTRTDKFWVDNIDVRTSPPGLILQTAFFRNQSVLELQFNQPVELNSPDLLQLKDSTNTILNPDSIHSHDAKVIAHFPNLSDGTYLLDLDDIGAQYGLESSLTSVSLLLQNPFYIQDAFFLTPNTIQLSLSRPIEYVDSVHSNVLLGQEKPVRISFQEDSTNSTYLDSEAYSLQLHYEQPLEFGNYRLRLKKLKEQQGWILRDSLYPLIHTYEPIYGDIQINEILFQPLEEKDDGYPDQSEYIELFNTTPYPISAEDLLIHKGADELGDIRPFRFSCEGCSPVAPDGIIPPNGYALIYPESESVRFEHSRLGYYLEAVRGEVVDEAGVWPFPSLSTSDGTSSTFGNLWDESRSDEQVREFYPALTRPLRYDAKTLSLTNGGSLLVLQKGDAILDSAYYSEDWHHQALPVHRGYALERIQSTRSGLLRENWGTSAGRTGGTPGWLNSLHTEFMTPFFENSWIQVSPQPFSPNHDGFDDHLQVSYELMQADYILRIRVYDLEGRVVKDLFFSRAGRNGSLLWDGKNNQGAGISPGLYILLAQATGSETGRDQHIKIPLIVAGAVKGR